MAEFNGTIGITKEDSISSYKPEKSLSNRPNIMYIVLDDIGFAQLDAMGLPFIHQILTNWQKVACVTIIFIRQQSAPQPELRF